ncbi:DNA polymerase III, delta subunit [Legionella moravica]|uniref:DNA polymerase III subunit delta n=2 Tax=Legionella moravica TaxID=39962 RepID=A0A378JZR0_9GAMM|nr:DNA polymerase III subunit delta [Legionella moravica]KTD34162.1 DNA polymerase III, delta subunit [Legionella moravica]STX62962.1 DNA polymerase III, delta subunit [Legionella moravica]
MDINLQLKKYIMQIKHQLLKQQIQKKLDPVYVLTGQDNYLIEDSLNSIKSSIKTMHDCDEKIISIQSSEDWNTVMEEANSYSLFSDTILLNILYDKKSIDATGKKILTAYLNAINPRCFIIIRAPNIPAKQLTWLSNHNQVLVVVAYPLSSDAMKSWIQSQFKLNSLNSTPQIADLIYQYTQGNMLACAQVIEKIALCNPPGSQITDQLALEHLFDQCDYSLYELVDACLQGQADKAIQILRQAVNSKSEPTLILWMLTQEIRLLLQLSSLIRLGAHIKNACSELKIWAQRVNLYQLAIKRFDEMHLQQLLCYCKAIDEQIKSSLNTQVWNSLEKLTLSLSLGTQCTV